MAVIESTIDVRGEEFRANAGAMAALVADRNYQALDQMVIEHLMGA